MFTENANRIFNRSIEEYHRWDDVDHPIDNPYAPGSVLIDFYVIRNITQFVVVFMS